MYKIISWAAVILWMTVIFNLSSQVAEQSGNLSRDISEVIMEAIERIAPKADIDINNLNYSLRKNAHFFAYFILGLLALNALRRSGVYRYKSIAVAAIICIFYAISDEIHQLYVPGRSGQLVDVLIDSAGAGVGIVVYQLVSNLIKHQ